MRGRQTVLGQLHTSGRFGAFMLVLLPGAATLGAKEWARLDYVTAAFGNASGVGTVAAIAAISLAVGGVVAGIASDRVRPQILLVSALSIVSLVNKIGRAHV